MPSTIRTLHVSFRPGQTAVFSVLIFCLLFTCSEIILRTRKPEPYPVFGYVEVENILHTLDNYAAEKGSIDCILLGSSLASVSINPQVFRQSFQEQTDIPLNCFVFGLPAATGSSMGVVAHILANRYHPQLLVLVTHSRAFDGRDSNQLEDEFPETPWARHHMGRFDPAGWLLEYSFSARYLQKLPEIIAASFYPVIQEKSVQDARPRSVPAHPVDGYYRGLISFHELAPLYMIRANIPIEQRVVVDPFPLSAVDMNGLQQVIDLPEQEGIAVVMVEIPALETFFEDTSVAPHPTARQAYSEILGSSARQMGIPFWVTSNFLDIPYIYYADGVHIHLSGALIYSEWLGSQLGEAVRLGLLDATLPEQFLSVPPLPEYVPERTFLDTYGLSEQEQNEYELYRTKYDLLPPEGRIFSPNATTLDLDYELAIIGLFIHWSETVTGSNRDQYFDLMVLRERMVYPEDLVINDQVSYLLADWSTSHNAANLTELGVDYLFYTEQWDNPGTAPDTKIHESAQYHLVWGLDFPPLHETYYLYRVD
jgi:hypothetical protein